MNANSGTGPLLTVSILTYNHAAFIEQCLDSVLAQQCDFAFKVAVFDDVSSDDTRQILKRYAESHPDIIELHLNPENLGPITNFKQSLTTVSTPYTATVEGDDFWCDTSKLQRQVELLEADNSLAGVFHDTEALETDGSRTRWRRYEKERFTLMDTISKTALLHTSAYVYRTSALQIHPGFTRIVSGDMALFNLTARHGDLVRIPEVLSVYRKHDGGITSGEVLQNYHTHRITLWNYLLEGLNGAPRQAAKEVLAFHQVELRKLVPSFSDKLKHRISILFK